MAVMPKPSIALKSRLKSSDAYGNNDQLPQPSVQIGDIPRFDAATRVPATIGRAVRGEAAACEDVRGEADTALDREAEYQARIDVPGAQWWNGLLGVR